MTWERCAAGDPVIVNGKAGVITYREKFLNVTNVPIVRIGVRYPSGDQQVVSWAQWQHKVEFPTPERYL